MLLDGLLGMEHRGRFQPVTGAGAEKDATLIEVFGQHGRTLAGTQVTEETCTGLSAVYAAVRLLSWTPATLPLVVYRRAANGDKEAQTGHWAYPLVHDRPNREMSAMKFREIGQIFVLLWGRFYAYLQPGPGGSIAGLWPLHPGEVGRERRLDGRLTYDVSRCRDHEEFPRPPTRKQILFGEEVLELSNLGGKGIVTHAREQWGEALAAQEYGGGFFAGGSLMAFAVKYTRGKIRDKAKLRERLQKVHGVRRQIPILDAGMELEKLGIPPKDAQFLESRQFYVTEIARWFGLPPHRLADLLRATYSNIAEQKLDWYEALLPWLTLWELGLTARLFTTRADRGLFVEHVVEGLLKGDIEKRYGAHQKGVQSSFAVPNEIRRLENKNNLGPAGDIILIPQNMHVIPLTEEATEFYRERGFVKPKEPEEPGEETGESGDKGQEIGQQAARAALRDRVRHAIAKEVQEVQRAAARRKNFVGWLDRFYGRFLAKMESILEPAAETCRMLGVEVDAERIAMAHCHWAHQRLLRIAGEVTAEELVQRIEADTETWETTLPAELVLERRTDAVANAA